MYLIPEGKIQRLDFQSCCVTMSSLLFSSPSRKVEYTHSTTCKVMLLGVTIGSFYDLALATPPILFPSISTGLTLWLYPQYCYDWQNISVSSCLHDISFACNAIPPLDIPRKLSTVKTLLCIIWIAFFNLLLYFHPLLLYLHHLHLYFHPQEAFDMFLFSNSH